MSNDFREATEYYQSNTTLWFGKYKGVPLSEIPKDYLVWLKYKTTWYSQFSKSLKRAITSNIPVEMRIKKIRYEQNNRKH